jgi:hypothetical protein
MCTLFPLMCISVRLFAKFSSEQAILRHPCSRTDNPAAARGFLTNFIRYIFSTIKYRREVKSAELEDA